jgi:hypothetical protein
MDHQPCVIVAGGVGVLFGVDTLDGGLGTVPGLASIYWLSARLVLLWIVLVV